MKGWTLLLVACVVGCGIPAPDPNKPSAPDTNDPAFTATGLAGWYLIGNAATPGQDEMKLVITAPKGTDVVDAYVGDLPVERMDKQSDGFALDISIKDVPAGTYDILFSANGSKTAFAKATWNRSAPYYVMISTDYDFSEPGDNSTAFSDMLHTAHPGLVITHFWAPYTYTDPAVTDDRRQALTTWLLNSRDTYGDEIALHIHPYCNFVSDAGLTCITDQSTVYTTGDTTGYTIRFNAYDRPSANILLQHARDLFVAHGLNAPATFRAGGWTADITSLQALADQGFIADSSALNWKRIAVWRGHELYTWNMEHWAPIDDTSQPYDPSESDITTTTPGSDLPLLEVPVNGVMADYLSVDAVNILFNENWDGTPLTSPHVLMSGFHPSTTLTDSDMTNMTTMLDLADAHLASAGTGPCVYITLSALTPVFPAQ